MSYTIEANDFIVNNNGQIIIFKMGSDYVVPTENEDGSLTWPTDADAAQANRNRVSAALVDPVKAQRFADLLVLNASTAYTIFLTEI